MKKQLYRVLAGLLIIISCMTGIEVMYAEEEETIRVGVYQMDGFHGYNEYGELEGYCIDYLNVVAGVTGWKYEYVDATELETVQLVITE